LLKETGTSTTVFVDPSIKVGVTTFMKLHSTFLYISLSAATAVPTHSHAQVTLPVWLQPTWIQAKLTDFHAKNTERYTVAQANTQSNTQSNAQQNTQVSTNNGTPNPNVTQVTIKQSVRLAPVETAVPKLNEKHLTADELVELRKQLRQQR
jgi:hypothetical protein